MKGCLIVPLKPGHIGEVEIACGQEHGIIQFFRNGEGLVVTFSGLVKQADFFKGQSHFIQHFGFSPRISLFLVQLQCGQEVFPGFLIPAQSKVVNTADSPVLKSRVAHFPDFLVQGKRLVELFQGFRIGPHVFAHDPQCGHAFREAIKLFALFPHLVGVFQVLHGNVKMFQTGMQDA